MSGNSLLFIKRGITINNALADDGNKMYCISEKDLFVVVPS